MTVDDDRMEDRNVNRIPNSTMQDVRDKLKKVDVLADAVEGAPVLAHASSGLPRTFGTRTSSVKLRSATSYSAVWILSMVAFC